jgi:hypothetical protein
MVADLQGPWNVKGCVMNILSRGTKSVGVPLVELHASFHAFKKAFFCIRLKSILDLRKIYLIDKNIIA